MIFDRRFTNRLLVCACLALSAAGALGEEYTFDSNGTRIAYRIDGEGDPVILIHGYTASGALNWRMPGIVKLLQNDYRVIVPDVRGHGKTGPAADGKYGMESLQDIIRLMDHLDIEKAHIVGYSMGGMMTIKLALDHPSRVKSAVVGGMGWVEPGSMGERGELYADVSPVLARVYDGFMEYETTADEMKAISVPFVVIVGMNDPGQLRRVDRWKTIQPDLPVVYIKDAQHNSCVFRPDFKKALKAFLDAQH